MNQRIYVLVLFLLPLLSYGQEPSSETANIDFNNVEMPEAPGSTGFSVYGNTPVNSATGTPNISIPLYTLEVDGVSVPISLSYNASGVKVSDLATAVGLNWSLNAGGGIYRSVRGKADENGWLSSSYGPLTDSWYANFDIDDSIWQGAMNGSAPGFDNGKNRVNDHNPDLYTYSFINYSGGFILGLDQNHTPLKDGIDGIDLSGYSPTSPIGILNDLNGNEFTFDVLEKSNTLNTYAKEDAFEEDSFGWSNVTTGWKLSEISTKNNETINFLYETVTTDYILNETDYNISLASPCFNPLGTSPSPLWSKTNTNYVYTNQLIKEINTSNGNIKIVFEYGTDNSLSHWKTKLNKITIHDEIHNRKKGFRFVYDTFDGDARLMLTEIYEFGNDGTTEKPPYLFSYNETYDLPAKNSFAQDFFGYQNNEILNNSLVHRSPSVETVFTGHSGFLDNNTGDRSLNTAALKNGILTQITYPTGGATEFSYEANVENGKYVGGLRISEMEDTDNGITQNRKTYQYEGLNGIDMESNINYTRQNEGNSVIFYSNFVALPGSISNNYRTGYFYDKVTITSIGGTDQFKEEHHYEEDPYSFTAYKYGLTKKEYFNGSTAVKVVEYINDTLATPRLVSWNILGDRACFDNNNTPKLGYNNKELVRQNGDYAFVAKRIATTEFLKKGGTLKPVTSVKDVDYDPKTMLVLKEITDERYTRVGFDNYNVDHPDGEKITIDYVYPFIPADLGFPAGFPKGTPVSKLVTSQNHGGAIGGQGFEFDTNGNIKTTYRFTKGEGSNSSASSWVDPSYEKMSSFLFSNGKPVEVVNEKGAPTSYIWGYNHQYPVAQIEGRSRASLNQSLVTQIETTTNENSLLTLLSSLRTDPSTASAMVTTYTHVPLAGVSTVTDPKGDRITYHYDVFGRLDYIEDKDGNILTENDYNYGN